MKTKTRERGKDGKFTTIKEGMEETVEIFNLLIRLIPFILIFLFALNYFGCWKLIKKISQFALNIGNPDCELLCKNAEEVNVPE